MKFYQYFITIVLSVKASVCDDLPCAVRQTQYGAVCVCNSTYCDTVERPPPLPRGRYYRYTTDSVNPGFHRTTGQFKSELDNISNQTIEFTINPNIKYQVILGFGGAFTDSTGVVVTSLPQGAQDKFIESYFSSNGIEYNMCRIPIGGTDFSPRLYSYDDIPFDEQLEYFALAEEDYKYKIPLIQQAIEASPHDIKFVASSFSSPKWMKMNDSWLVTYVKEKYYDAWAQYHVKFMDAYAENGIKMWTLTGGNEVMLGLLVPCLIVGNGAYPHDHVRWYRDYLAPSLAASSHSHVKLLVMDDVRMFANAWMSRFSLDPVAYQLIEGIAIHWYFDWYVQQDFVWKFADLLHKEFPDKLNVFTESSVNVLFSGEPVELGSWTRGTYYIYSIIQNLNHWTNGYIDWNIALDMDGGPNLNLPTDAAIIVNSSSGEFYKNPIFYGFGHFSKFIPPGSIRVDVKSNQNETSQPDLKMHNIIEVFKESFSYTPHKSNESHSQTFNVKNQESNFTMPQRIFCTATVNSDNSSTIIFFNSMDSDVNVTIEDTVSGYISATLTANSINTFVYWPSSTE